MSGPTHGKASTYRSARYKCRCTDCRRANTERCADERRRRTERLAADPSLAPHGVPQTYVNWGCRCTPCAEANSYQCREWYWSREDAA